jgi:putative PIN family toxin of toxin-antitoxin system
LIRYSKNRASYQQGHEFEPKALHPGPGTQDICVVTTTPPEASLRAEVIRVLERPRIRTKYGLTPERIAELQERLVRTAELVTPLSPLPVHSRDAHDDLFLAIALGGNAEYLITGDDDLLVLDGHRALGRLRIVTVRDFLEILAERGGEQL